MSVTHPSVASDLPARDRDKDTKIIYLKNFNVNFFESKEFLIR